MPQVGTWWVGPEGGRWVVVQVAEEAGGGRAWLNVDNFDPTMPVMIPCWSVRRHDMRPLEATVPEVQPRHAEPERPTYVKLAPDDTPTTLHQASQFVRPMFAARDIPGLYKGSAAV